MSEPKTVLEILISEGKTVKDLPDGAYDYGNEVVIISNGKALGIREYGTGKLIILNSSLLEAFNGKEDFNPPPFPDIKF